MIFEDLSFLDNLPIEKRANFFGNKRKPQSKTAHRSSMMLNPLNIKHLNSMDRCVADVITINLEDAIAPSRKREALYNAALFLSNLDTKTSQIVVRINPLNQGGDLEVKLLEQFEFDAFRVPKVKSAHDIDSILKLTDKPVHISLETREAFGDIKALVIDKRVCRANLGILDLLVSLGLPQSLLFIGNPTIEYILSKFLVECKTAGIEPVSFMFQDYNNVDNFTKWCEMERKMGFTSKACMGPKQVEIANKIFSPNPDEIARAVNIKKLFEANELDGINGFMSEEYGFIDEPIYKDALNILI